MSGFDPTWLDLREPADHRARNRDVLAACARHFAGRTAMEIVDLGCGLGSNLRALAPHLPAYQSWRLIDHDPVLLAAARERLASWAESAETAGERLRLNRDGKTIDVAFVQADLSRGAGHLFGNADLVTAAALFDLVSESWLERFVADVVAERVAFYTVLTYDGVETWSPAHAGDAAMLSAFHAHQARDKGFGPAAGPHATVVLHRVFANNGYAVDTGDSRWRLAADDRALISALAEGFANACAETGLVDPSTVTSWRAARSGATVEVGHLDLFARPA